MNKGELLSGDAFARTQICLIFFLVIFLLNEKVFLFVSVKQTLRSTQLNIKEEELKFSSEVLCRW